MEETFITIDDVKKFKEIVGERGGGIISVLGRLFPTFNTYVNHEIGREILRSEVNRMGELLEKICRGKASEEELIEFKFLKETKLPYILKRLDTYFKNINLVKRVVSRKND